MRRNIKGMAILEILLAVTIVSGILVLIAKAQFSSARYTNSKNIGKHHGVLVNAIVTEFVSDSQSCDDADDKADCPVGKNYDDNATDYLNLSNSIRNSYEDVGIYPDDITVETCLGEADSNCF